MFEGALQTLIDELGMLPGVGPKSAQRMALYLLDAEPDDVTHLVDAIQAVREKYTTAKSAVISPKPTSAPSAVTPRATDQ